MIGCSSSFGCAVLGSHNICGDSFKHSITSDTPSFGFLVVIFMHVHIQNPMQFVFNSPMIANILRHFSVAGFVTGLYSTATGTKPLAPDHYLGKKLFQQL